MQGSLTKRQHEMLAFIEGFIEDRGYSPSLEEIAAGVGLSSLATVHVHLNNLEKKKRIRRAWNRSRSIEIVRRKKSRDALVEVPLLGRVAAGAPIEAIQTAETVEAPPEFVRGRETFALKVQGDSMIDEQIRDGDTIIVERRETAENGETAVVLIDGSETTVKKFYREGPNKIRLQPANAALKPLVLDAGSCAVQGVVIGLLRKY